MKSVNQYVMKDSGVQWIGEVPEHWEVCKIKNKFMIISGGTPKSDVESYWNGDVIWVTPADYNTEDKVIIKGKRNITEEGLKNSSATILPKNSIVFSKRAPIGLVAINAVPLATNQGCLGCIPKLNVDTIYSYFLLSSFQKQFELLGSGTTFKEISLSSFSSFVIPLPPLSEQRAIADWLDAKCADIDAAIELQQRMIDKLKAYKTAVIHQAVTKGLDKNLKPTDLKDSGIKWLGMIPKHWNISALRYVLSLYTGNSISDEKKFYYTDPIDAIPYISTKDVDVNYQTINYNNGLYIKKNDSLFRVAPKGSVLMCIAGGSAGKKKAYTNQDVAFVNKLCCFLAGDSLFDKFLFYFLMSPSFEHNFNQYLTGIIGGVTIPVIKNIRICLPPLTEQRAIADWLDAKCADIDATIALKEQKQEKLKAYKKTIIFEYVTGKKQVANINKQL